MTVTRRPGSDLWQIEFTFQGQRFRKSSGTASRRKAEALERRWRQDLHDRAVMGVVADLSWAEALARYDASVVAPRGNAAAAKRDRYVFAHLRAALGAEAALAALTAPVIAAFRDAELRRGKAPATVNRYLAMVKAVLRKAHSEWGALAVVPTIRLLPLNNARHRWLTEAEEARLLAHSPPHLHDLCVFLIETGARLSEAVTLTWADVDLERLPRPAVRFMTTKSGKPRSVPLTQRAVALLRRLAEACPPGETRVFLYRPQGQMGCVRMPGTTCVPFRNPHGAWSTATRAAGLADLKLHDLRHTFASRLVMRGVPLLTVSKLLGHASMQMTLRYSHLGPDALDTAITALDTVRVAADAA
ncbi:tyrosine-type recombinase/integrase [Azospirillum melinis]